MNERFECALEQMRQGKWAWRFDQPRLLYYIDPKHGLCYERHYKNGNEAIGCANLSRADIMAEDWEYAA